VIDTATRAEIARIPLAGLQAAPGDPPSPLKPVGLLIDPTNRFAFVACTNVKRIDVIDLSTWQVSSHIETGNVPDGMAWAFRSRAFALFDDPLHDHP
jgi:DNA-binding beta-propeller fold protein YncE